MKIIEYFKNYFWKPNVGDIVITQNVVDEYKNIIGKITRITGFYENEITIIKGNKYHKKNGRIYISRKDLLKKIKDDSL